MGIFGGEEEQPKRYEIADGKPLKCLVCGHDRFWSREAQLNTAVATFFNIDWANRSANCFVCDNCTYIHWFLPK